VVSAFAAIESKAEFQERCHKERRRLGVGGVSSTLADGAPWIWSLAEAVFGKTDECLDIFHALEHVSDCDFAILVANTSRNVQVQFFRHPCEGRGLDVKHEHQLSRFLPSQE
jgi:hypothetical protein